MFNAKGESKKCSTSSIGLCPCYYAVHDLLLEVAHSQQANPPVGLNASLRLAHCLHPSHPLLRSFQHTPRRDVRYGLIPGLSGSFIELFKILRPAVNSDDEGDDHTPHGLQYHQRGRLYAMGADTSEVAGGGETRPQPRVNKRNSAIRKEQNRNASRIYSLSP